MKHNFSILLVMCILMVIGVALTPRLDISNEPRPEQGKTLTISYWWQNASAKVVEQNITSRIEAAVSAVKGVEKVSSVSQFGSGRITVEMKPNANVSMAKFEIASILRQLRPKLPEYMSFPIVSGGEVDASRADDNEVKLILTYQLNADMSEEQIKQLAEKDTKRFIERIDGVNNVQVSGTMSHYMEISYDADDIAVYGLTNNDIVEAIRNFTGREDVIGEVTTENGRVTVPLILTSKGNGKTFEQMPLRTVGGKIIYLNNLTTCNIREKQPDSYYRVNGMNSVYVNVYADKDASVVRVSGKVKAVLEDDAKDSFLSKHSTLTYDRAEIQMKEFHTLLLRSSLTLAILLLFVWVAGGRNWVYTGIITIALLANILIAVLLYWLFDLRLHPMSMAGITVSLGIIIDSTIVMVDHYGYYRNRKAFIGILAAMLTTIGSLVIVFWLPDFLRHDLKDFSVVVIINLAIAIIVASIFVPALIERFKFVSKRAIIRRTFRLRFVIAFTQFYRRYVEWCQYRFGRFGSLFLFSIIFGSSLFLFVKCLDSNAYIRKNAKLKLYVYAKMPVGGSIQELNEKVKELEVFLSHYNKINRFETRITPNNAFVIVDFKKEWEFTDFPLFLEKKVISKVLTIGGADWSVAGISENGFHNADLAKLHSSIIRITGYDYSLLYLYAEKICDDLQREKNIEDIDILNPQQMNHEYEYYMNYNFETLKMNYINLYNVYNRLHNILGDLKIEKVNIDNITNVNGNFKTNNSTMDVLIHPINRDVFDMWYLQNAYVNYDGSIVNPSFYMNIGKRIAPQSITRENQIFTLEIGFNVISLWGQDKVIEKIKTKYAQILPEGFKCTDVSFDSFEDDGTQYWLIGLVAVIIFFVIAILFESLMQAMAVVLLIPVSFIGLFLTYYITGVPFGTGGFAAMVLLAGLTVNAGIYIICQNNNQHKMYMMPVGLDKKRLLKIGCRRYVTAFNHKIIPILLTILSTILGMIPFLIDGPDEQPFWYSLAVGTIGGLIFSVVPIFLFLPSVLNLKISKMLFVLVNSNSRPINTMLIEEQ